MVQQVSTMCSYLDFHRKPEPLTSVVALRCEAITHDPGGELKKTKPTDETRRLGAARETNTEKSRCN
jgi:hypothetical protein